MEYQQRRTKPHRCGFVIFIFIVVVIARHKDCQHSFTRPTPLRQWRGHYSRIENDKSDPALSSLTKIAKALGINVAELFTADDVFKDVNSVDKTLMEKISLIELLEKKEKAAFFTMLDALVSKKKLKDNLTSALQLSA